MTVTITLQVDASVPSQLEGETDRQFAVRAVTTAEGYVRQAIRSDNRMKLVTLSTRKTRSMT